MIKILIIMFIYYSFVFFRLFLIINRVFEDLFVYDLISLIFLFNDLDAVSDSREVMDRYNERKY